MERKILIHLARSNIRKNKLKSILVIIGLILTCVLFTVSTILVTSFNKSYSEMNMKTVGEGMRYHAFVASLDDEQLEKIKLNKNIKAYDIIQKISTIDDGAFSRNNLQIIAGGTENFAKQTFTKVDVGHMPTEMYEIALPSWALDYLKLPYELGENVNLQFEFNNKVYNENFILSGYWYSDPNIQKVGYVYLDTDYSSMLLKNYDINKNLEQLNAYGSYSIYFYLNNSFNIEEKVDQILIDADIKQYPYGNAAIGINWAYTESTFTVKSILMLTIILLIFYLNGFLLIYCIVNIFMKMNIRSYSSLKLIGMTNKQLKKTLIYEVYILSSIGIILGVSIGLIIAYLILPIIINLTTITTVVFSITAKNIVLISVSSFCVVLFSYLKCFKYMRNISVVEGAKIADVNRLMELYQRRKLDICNLGKIQFCSNVKKIIYTTLSLVIGFIVYYSSINFSFGISVDKYLDSMMIGDYVISYDDYFNGKSVLDYLNYENRIDSSMCDEVSELQISDSTAVMYNGYRNDVECTDYIRNILENYREKVKENKSYYDVIDTQLSNNEIPLGIYAVDKSLYEYISDNLIEGNLDVVSFDKGESVIAIINKKDASQGYYNIGEQIVLKSYDMNLEYTITGISDKENLNNILLNWNAFNGVCIITSEDEYIRNFGNDDILSIFIYTDNNIDNDLENLTSTNDYISFSSKEKLKDSFEDSVLLQKILGLTFSIFVLSIGFINLMNTVVSNNYAKKDEYKIMQKIGISKKQIKEISLIENFYYVLIASIINILVVFIALNPLLEMIISKNAYGLYSFNPCYILYYVVIEVVVVVVTNKISIEKI